MKGFALLVFSVLAALAVPGCLGSEPTTDDEVLDEALETPSLEAQCEPRPETKTEHVGSCGTCKTSSGYNGLWHVKYERECCLSCTPWVKVSSTCGPCAG